VIQIGRGALLYDVSMSLGITLEQERVVEAPGVTHLRFRVVR
jgi:hypothetical protein